MAKSSCFDVIKIQKRVLTLTGIWPAKKTFFYIIKRLTSWSLVYSFTVILWFETYRNRNNYTSASELFSYALTTTSCAGKAMIFRMKEKEILDMLELLKMPIFSSYSNKTDKYMKNTIKDVANISKVYIFIAIMVTSTLTIKPLLIETDLPIAVSFCSGSCVLYMYVYQIFVFATAIVNLVSFDLLGSGLMAIASVQFKILSKKLSTVRDPLIGKNTKSDETINQVLYHCVSHHLEIIKFVDSIQKIFTNIFLIQFVEGMLCICNIGFQLAHVSPDNIQFYIMLGYFFGKLQQTGLYCWFGNGIIEESSKIGYSCFKSQWYKCGPKVRKTLFLIMERAKRPTILTAGKFSKLSLASFMGLLNTSYSYFALMQRLYKNSQEKN